MAKKPLYKKIFRLIRDIIFIILLKPIWKRIIKKIKTDKVCKKLIEESHKSGKPVVIYVSHFDYYSHLQQRPNHMFNILASKGYPCVFCSYRKKYTNPIPNMHVIPISWLNYILKVKCKKVFDVPFNYPYRDIPDLFKYINDEALVIYELIDDFDLLATPKIINQAKEVFKRLVARDKTFVLASADKLYDIALNLGAKKSKLISSKNAVNFDDFNKTDTSIPESMQKIINKKKPIIGYYGALTATWFDFDLMFELVKKHPEYEVVLIGLIYPDENIEKTKEYIDELKQYDNFTYIPPVNYKEIPNYAKCWDVATIPFQINDITLSTSPVKLFEYMAMGLPIVTTPMPECKLYKSVFIAKDIKEFEEKIKTAISKKEDEKYKKLLHKEALENTWEQRVNDFVKIIEDNHKG